MPVPAQDKLGGTLQGVGITPEIPALSLVLQNEFQRSSVSQLHPRPPLRFECKYSLEESNSHFGSLGFPEVKLNKTELPILKNHQHISHHELGSTETTNNKIFKLSLLVYWGNIG